MFLDYLQADVVSFTTRILVWFITICSAQREKLLGMDSIQLVLSILKDLLTFACIYPDIDFFFINSSNHIFEARSCSKTCFVGLLIRSIFRGKIARALQRECSFSSEKSNESTDQQDMFCFNHASAFYTSNNVVKNVDE